MCTILSPHDKRKTNKQMSEQTREQWMSMRTAAKRLGVSPNKISRLASKGKIKWRANPLDERVHLVDFNELKTLFESAPTVITDEDDKE